MTRLEAIEKIKLAEKEKEFDRNIDPIDYSICEPVTDQFPYVKHGFLALKSWLIDKIFVSRVTRKVCKTYKPIYRGQDNFKGIDSAILISNHVYMFDSLINRKGIKGHKVNTVAAWYNNRSDKMGSLMRAANMMPLSKDMSALINFNKAVKYKLNHKEFISFYPEQEMWWMYEKPRPFKNGAFHYATKNKKPLIPIFITFKDQNKKDSEGITIKQFFVNYLKPIYPKESLNNKENIEYLKVEAKKQWVKCYEDFYNKKLTFE